VPVLANMTEFGKTQLFNKSKLGEWGADMILYPLSAFRAMNRAAEKVYQCLLDDGDQNAVVDTMQTRAELYDYLNYHAFENKLDELFAQSKSE
jgi:methylisocitrate lyase